MYLLCGWLGKRYSEADPVLSLVICVQKVICSWLHALFLRGQYSLLWYYAYYKNPFLFNLNLSHHYGVIMDSKGDSLKMVHKTTQTKNIWLTSSHLERLNLVNLGNFSGMTVLIFFFNLHIFPCVQLNYLIPCQKY